jgi:DNA-binding SARP family transcriptional activator
MPALSKDCRDLVAVRIQLHGRFAVSVGGRPVEHELPGRRGRLLVAALALSRRSAMDRQILIDMLWRPSVPGRGAAATFAALLSKVRAVLEPAEIRGRGSLQLVLPEGSIVDAAVAEAALHGAETATAQQEWRRAWTEAISALFVTQRRFLADFDDPWVDVHRRELAHAHCRVLSCYAEACLHLGPTELASAERSARSLIALEPLAETGYCLLMRALDQRGDRAAALEVYEQLRQTLRDDLGATPGPVSRARHALLLRSD